MSPTAAAWVLVGIALWISVGMILALALGKAASRGDTLLGIGPDGQRMIPVDNQKDAA